MSIGFLRLQELCEAFLLGKFLTVCLFLWYAVRALMGAHHSAAATTVSWRSMLCGLRR